MTNSRNGPVQVKGVPSGARRVLALGYYDGATEGVLEADTGDEYRFEVTDEVRELSRRDGRSYFLRLLPEGSLDHLERIIGPHFPPRWPMWCPIWRFPDEATKLDVERLTEIVLSKAGPVEWEVSTSTPWDLGQFIASNPTTASAERG